MPVELFIAIRYLKARRNGVFTFLTTLIAIGGIALGVSALVVTLAVMSGFHGEIRAKILGLSPHIMVMKNGQFSEYNVFQNYIKQNKNIEAVSPFVYGQVVIKNKASSQGAVLKGIDWNNEIKIVSLGGILKDNEKITDGLSNGEILLGNELAINLGAVKGDDIVVMSPGQSLTVPKMKKFRVKAVFHSGMFEYDSTMAYVGLKDSQSLFDMPDSVTGIGVKVKNADLALEVENELKKDISFPYMMRTWQQMNRNLFSALKLEKIMMFIILALIIIVAAFNIISNLLLLTVEKSREIGILSALGFDRDSVSKIFFYEGAIVGFLGIALGTAGGVMLSLLLKRYQFVHLPSDVYYLDSLPVQLVFSDVASVIAVTVLITLVSVIYPSYQASKLDPIEAIRYG